MRSLIVIFLLLTSIKAYDEPFAYDPFKKAQVLIQKESPKAQEKQKVKKNSIVLSAIMSDKAFINGKWYGLGDKFGSFKVDMIRQNMVGLKRGGKVKIITLGRKKHLFTIKEKE